MNATRWPSLTEFAKYLGRESLCRVEDTEKGLHISWIDNSPEALRRQDAIRKKERQDKGDEEREQRLIQEQVQRARHDAKEKSRREEEEEEEEAKEEANRLGLLQREEGDKITLNLTAKQKETKQTPTPASVPEKTPTPPAESVAPDPDSDQTSAGPPAMATNSSVPTNDKPPVKFVAGVTKSKPKNVFAIAAAAKKNPLHKTAAVEPPKRPMSEAERIMKEELERKRMRQQGASGANMTRLAKRQRIQ